MIEPNPRFQPSTGSDVRTNRPQDLPPDTAEALTETVNGWSSAQASALYRVPEWSNGYFSVNERGHVAAHPDRDEKRSIDLYEVIQGLNEREIRTPLLIRFSDIVEARMREHREVFDREMEEVGYRGGYSCVYPIKVNQQQHFVSEVCSFAAELGFGLEVGSKPELIAAIGLAADYAAMPIVCNGFKDDEYIETVILGTKLGLDIIPVVEKFNELVLIVKHAHHYGVRPRIGIRVRLAARGAGKWDDSAGTSSKFGLYPTEVLRAVELLRENEMLDCFELLHCHIGSQVQDIRNIKNAVTEMTHVYTELHRLGAKLGLLDIGGGLGVDYDGNRAASGSSMNYDLAEYAADVVWRVKTVCDEKEVPHPKIITESGRSLAAFGSVLICDVIGTSAIETNPDRNGILQVIDAEEDVPQPLLDLLTAYDELATGDALGVFHDTLAAHEEAQSLFSLGYMSLPVFAGCEQLYRTISVHLLRQVRAMEAEGKKVPKEFLALPQMVSDTYFCNFSLFQSLPDLWAIGQTFPICPVHRLDEKPTQYATLADITCDSHGKIDCFIGKEGEKGSLELHDLKGKPGEWQPYYLGFFLVGAYQEILGDLHNLFGDTHAVHVRLSDDGEWSVDEIIEGDTVRRVLEYVQFDVRTLRRSLRRRVERAQREGQLTVQEGADLLRFYESGLDGYTYLES